MFGETAKVAGNVVFGGEVVVVGEKLLEFGYLTACLGIARTELQCDGEVRAIDGGGGAGFFCGYKKRDGDGSILSLPEEKKCARNWKSSARK